ncbi:metallophosphoesterase family protein [Inconstantimicrobium porci]|uniref:metallophosphoesterase family protein n=1 Tax=Inconstantimicrobium porci TaxID=2652291 RepID=UPI00240A85E5|nr:YfcE family phosphodiesterase [Inconstantimicrobium porci]MDD6771658.1 YfcE family phosphodiesterase [Inconstantimicrobium porci]
MKIAVLSDVHGNASALERVLDDLKNSNIKKVIILGDMIMKGPMPQKVLKLLHSSNLEILAWVKGNTDLWFQEFNYNIQPLSKEAENFTYYKYAVDHLDHNDISFINNLPDKQSLFINNKTILCVHGTPKSIVEAIDSTVSIKEIKKAIDGVSEDIILSGHSHTSYIGECNGKKIFNVGSIGNMLDGDNRISYGILDFSNEKVKFINKRLEYNTAEAIECAKTQGFPYIDKYKNLILKAEF